VLDSPHVIDPKVGWLYNSNNWPYSAAGPDSPKRADYPRYMDTAGESPRGLHAIRVLEGRKDFTIERLRRAAYDSYLTAFARLVPGLVRAWDEASGPLRARLADQIALLRGWDDRWGIDSVPTSLAIYWGEEMVKRASDGKYLPGLETYDRIDAAPAAMKLEALAAASDHLERDFGTWRTPWGEINRFQRLNDDIAPHFTDSGASIPVGFPWSRWGTLASFAATASSQSSNSGPACMPSPSPPAAKAAIRGRRISTTRPSATPPAICARSISGRMSSRSMSSGRTGRAVKLLPGTGRGTAAEGGGGGVGHGAKGPSTMLRMVPLPSKSRGGL
jgi:acyl-homoserine lactone acylase PvdQ